MLKESSGGHDGIPAFLNSISIGITGDLDAQHAIAGCVQIERNLVGNVSGGQVVPHHPPCGQEMKTGQDPGHSQFLRIFLDRGLLKGSVTFF